MSKPFKGGAHAYQRFNFVMKGQAHERNAEASNRTWEIRPYWHYRGVAKQANTRYTPEATTWVKIKNREYSQAIGREDFFDRRRG
jgi:hypothetical protein